MPDPKAGTVQILFFTINIAYGASMIYVLLELGMVTATPFILQVLAIARNIACGSSIIYVLLELSMVTDTTSMKQVPAIHLQYSDIHILLPRLSAGISIAEAKEEARSGKDKLDKVENDCWCVKKKTGLKIYANN